MPEAHHRLDDDPHRDAEERGAVDERGQDLPPEIAVRLGARARLLRQPRDEERQSQRACVGEDVAGVREQCQRVRQPSADGLDDENEGRQRERPRQRSRRPYVIVAVRVHVRTQAVGVRMAVGCEWPCECPAWLCAIRERKY